MARPKRNVPPEMAAVSAAAQEVIAGRAKALAEKYRLDPTQYIKDKMGWTPWSGDEEHPGQQQVIDSYQLALAQQLERREWQAERIADTDLKVWTPGQIIKNRIRVPASHTVGKCASQYDTHTLSNGQRVTGKDLICLGSFELLTLVDGLPTPVYAKATDNGIKSVYSLCTDTGKSIRRTIHHPIYAANVEFRGGCRPKISVLGFTPIQDLRVGDLVSVAEELPAFGGEYLIKDCEIKLSAYLLGDGSYTTSAVSFTQVDGAILDEFKECAVEIGCGVTDKYGKYQYYMNRGEAKIGDHPARNFLIRTGMVEPSGVGGKAAHARYKKMPNFVFQLSKRQLSLFLSRLYSTDGWASVTKDGKQKEIGYCSASKQLAEEVQYLLQKLGVHARLFPKRVPGYDWTYWTVGIKDSSDIMKFSEEVGIFGKEAAVTQVVELARLTYETKQRNVAVRPNKPRWCHKNAPVGTRWEKIKSITYIGEEPTVAIEVPIYDTYLTEFYEHNTKMASGLINHFYDCYLPSIIYTFAPTMEQVHDLLFKEIKADRQGKGLPGRILDLRLDDPKDPLHFAIGKATNNTRGMGTERAQGQHGEYLFFVLDEAEGVADFVYDAVDSMTSGGIAIVLFLANPKTDTSRFHEVQYRDDTVTLRISSLWHPNVLADKEIVPNAIKRDYVISMLKDHCTEVAEHDITADTFELPWDEEHKIYRPDGEFMFRVLGQAPTGTADNIFITRNVYHSALERKDKDVLINDPQTAYMGVDVARYGTDFGTFYVRHAGIVRRVAQFSKQDTSEYWRIIRDECIRLVEEDEVNTIDIRIDGGGGFGGGVIDQLEHDFLLQSIVPHLIVREIHFNGVPYSWKSYGDIVTEMYAEASESLLGVKLVGVPNSLEEDLTKRIFKWMNYKGISIRVLEPKDDFRKRVHRSPDDGDGFILCMAPTFIFDHTDERLIAETPIDIGPQFSNYFGPLFGPEGIGPQL